MAPQRGTYEFIYVDGRVHFVNLLGSQGNGCAFGDERIVAEGRRKFHDLDLAEGDFPVQWSAHGMRITFACVRCDAIELQSSNGLDW